MLLPVAHVGVPGGVSAAGHGVGGVGRDEVGGVGGHVDEGGRGARVHRVQFAVRNSCIPKHLCLFKIHCKIAFCFFHDNNLLSQPIIIIVFRCEIFEFCNKICNNNIPTLNKWVRKFEENPRKVCSPR